MFHDEETNRDYVFLTNNFRLAAATIAAIYKRRWQIELFFKWIKQNLQIKTFLGTSENAVMTQIADMDRAHTHSAGCQHQVPDQGRNQPDGNHNPPQGTTDEQQPLAGAALARQKNAGKATRLEHTTSVGVILEFMS